MELRQNADPGIVAGRIDVKGETAEGQEPWLRAEERFFHDFYHNHAATITRRATRTRLATPQDEHAIPLQQVNVPVLNLEWIQSRLSPATLESLMQVWGLVGRSPFPPSPSGKAREGSRRIPTADARLLREAGIIEEAFSTITGGWTMPFFCCGGENHRFTTTMDRVATRQERRRPLRGQFSSFTHFSLFATCDG
ncbi:hypothetical protein C3747_182g65 [Trypanosoma cruzi]|uniref:Target of rapamycin (TOR) kinase 1 n=1 Tax=Trypanosoma cruzi TaxID=5693 RepID=A0A2V2W2Y0_TRYCR|nr:hypothetical protein C3747_182g65 [Trypanosoma cruzi]RNC39204.1 rab1 small GTP-binding protein [Trypanosoma cruzi]